MINIVFNSMAIVSRLTCARYHLRVLHKPKSEATKKED
jgi:hypothetical protein